MPAEVTGPRRFPAPWSVQEMEESFVVQDAHCQPLAYLFFDDEPSRRTVTKRSASRPTSRSCRGCFGGKAERR